MQHTRHRACHRVSPECVTSVSSPSSKASPSISSLICHLFNALQPRPCVRAINTPAGRETGFHCLSLKGSDSGGMLFCALRNFDKHTFYHRGRNMCVCVCVCVCVINIHIYTISIFIPSPFLVLNFGGIRSEICVYISQ